MSHFTVLCIIPADLIAEYRATESERSAVDLAIAEMLAPYDENMEVDPYRAYLDEEEVLSMAQSYEIDATNLTALVEKMKSWAGFEGGIDEKGLYRLSTYNPLSKWDWYQIGGQWRNCFISKLDADLSRLIFQAEGLIHDLVYDRKTDLRRVRCDGGPKGLLDLKMMRKIAGDSKRDEFIKLNAIIAEHGPLPPSLRLADTNAENWPEVKAAYWAHPTIVAMERAGLYGFMELPDEGFALDEETEVLRAEAAAVPGYATLTPTQWLTPGDMGWFGMSHATENGWGRYWESANALVDRAADDDYLVIVDAHI